MEVVVTTDRRPSFELVEDAKRLSEKLGTLYVKRRHKTIEEIKKLGFSEAVYFEKRKKIKVKI